MRAEEKRNIVLCGFMATGKSSVGKTLAAMVGYDFLDMDAMIEAEAGMSILQIFSSRGEPAFRALESNLVARLTGKTRTVIATGGGTIGDPLNLERLRNCGVVITLTADTQTILQRIGPGDDRPMLKEGDRIERIRSLLDQRAQAYAQADIILDTSSLGIDEVAQHIVDRLQEFGYAL